MSTPPLVDHVSMVAYVRRRFYVVQDQGSVV